MVCSYLNQRDYLVKATGAHVQYLQKGTHGREKQVSPCHERFERSDHRTRIAECDTIELALGGWGPKAGRATKQLSGKTVRKPSKRSERHFYFPRLLILGVLDRTRLP